MKAGLFANLAIAACLLAFAGERTAAQSPLASGEWRRLFVEQTGVYRLTYDDLKNMGFSDPSQIRIYGNGGAMLPEKPTSPIDGLREIPIMMICRNEGQFVKGDYALFYAEGPLTWCFNKALQRYEHSLHLWDKRSVYFVTQAAGGKRITDEAAPTTPANCELTSFDEHLVVEEERKNLLNSGRSWYGIDFSNYPKNQTFELIDPVEGAQVKLSGAVVAQTPVADAFNVSLDGQTLGSVSLPAKGDAIAAEAAFEFTGLPDNSHTVVTLSPCQSGASIFPDYLRMTYRRRLKMASSQLQIRDNQSVSLGNIANFNIDNASSDVQVWDVTDINAVKRMDTRQVGTALTFTAATDSLREFIAFRPSEALQALSEKEPTPARDLRTLDADFIIVTNPVFAAAAERLAALHRENDGLTVEVVSDVQAYNEFSSGKQDPAAIRNLAKCVYERSHRLKYLLLLGDGSFDNKSNLFGANVIAKNSNFIVTYQSAESLHNSRSFVSDDYFGILDDDADILFGRLNIGVGRLPVKTVDEAELAVTKIEQYMTTATGNWCNRAVLIADNGDMNQFAHQSDSLARYLRSQQPRISVDKLYLAAFEPVTTVDGLRFPQVTESLQQAMSNGCFLVNYVGHGSVSGLSEERIVCPPVIEAWRNRVYPIFVAATCEFGQYDNISELNGGNQVCGAERALLNPKGGAIALLVSSRLVYSSPNFQLNMNFLRALSLLPAEGEVLRLGDYVRLCKNSSDASINLRCFALLGDPALRLPTPQNTVRTIAVNGKPLNEADTLKANATVTLTAEMVDRQGKRMIEFNGTVAVTVFDKARTMTTLPDGSVAAPVVFETQTSTLFRGTTTVHDGVFDCTFIVPRDIDYRYGLGKVTYFAHSDALTAAGSDPLTIGGATSSMTNDVIPPDIRLYMNDTLFRDGGITDTRPTLIAKLYDESGVSATDAIAHSLTATLDGDPATTVNLNPYYEAQGTYRNGTVTFRFAELPIGEHELTLSAWDVVGNGAQASLRFNVTNAGVLKIERLRNYPNPFSYLTYIYFEHNLPEEPVEAEFQVFDLAGRLLRHVKKTVVSVGYAAIFEWDGTAANGSHINNGIYPYRIIISNRRGQKAFASGKIMLSR